MKITASLDARDIRLAAHIVLPRAPRDNMLNFEIPLGVVRRGRVEEINHQLGTEETETIHFAEPVRRSGLLENSVEEPSADWEIKPYEIDTYRILEKDR